MRHLKWLCGGIAVATIGAAILWPAPMRKPLSILKRRPEVVLESAYREEMQCAFACGCPGCPGGRPQASPNGRYLASTRDNCAGSEGLWDKLKLRECYIHDIQVVN